MMHNSVGRKGRTDQELNKPYAVLRCNKFMKGVDRADKYLNCFSDPRKTVKWPNVSAKMHILKCVFVH